MCEHGALKPLTTKESPSAADGATPIKYPTITWMPHQSVWEVAPRRLEAWMCEHGALRPLGAEESPSAGFTLPTELHAGNVRPQSGHHSWDFDILTHVILKFRMYFSCVSATV